MTTPNDLDFDAVRDRIRQFGETFKEGYSDCPAIDPAEIEALVSLTDEELNHPQPLTRFATKYGVSLDWLILGKVQTGNPFAR